MTLAKLSKNHLTPIDQQLAQQLNRFCYCSLNNKQALITQLQKNHKHLYDLLIEQRPYLFADRAIFVADSVLQKQYQLIHTIESVMALPAYQQQVLAYAPISARFIPNASGVFLGYDFHVTADSSQLIEINTNAGGAALNAIFLQINEIDKKLDSLFIAMFHTEWQKERGLLQPLRTIAIVDEQPNQQFLLPEFILFQQLFARHQIQSVICDPSELVYRDNRLYVRDLEIDLIYNRLTDFGLEEPAQEIIKAAYLANKVVLTPHPRSHALYADKRNLAILSNAQQLQALGVDQQKIDILVEGIAPTWIVQANAADELWAYRKKLFFKPSKGYGSKAVYRGDKLTKRVFDAILQGNYVAQQLIPPSERYINAETPLKFDLRHYSYQDQILLTSGRLYQGQTTNFRTVGGGFAPIITISDQQTASCCCHSAR